VTLNSLAPLTLQLVKLLKQLEPYGQGNPEPTFKVTNLRIVERTEMGSDRQHLKLHLADGEARHFAVVGFNQSKKVVMQTGDRVNIWLQLTENEWRGSRTAEGRLLKVAFAGE
jgi:single-stranded-DNA-specific exonuclease